jgi:hypothetical protein
MNSYYVLYLDVFLLWNCIQIVIELVATSLGGVRKLTDCRFQERPITLGRILKFRILSWHGS